MNIEVRKQITQILIEWREMTRAVESIILPPKSKFTMLTLRCGICANILDNIEECDLEVFDLELEGMFREDGLDDMYPFNMGALEYSRECKTNSIHLNAARMAWVDKTIALYS